MNEVDVDQDALASEAAAVPLPEEPAAAPAGEPAATSTIDASELIRAEEFARRAEPIVGKVLAGLARVIAPNWSIDPDQHKGLAQSTSFALALWFPHEIPPKYVALLMVGVSLYGIAQTNADPETGKLKPLRAQPKTDGATTAL